MKAKGNRFVTLKLERVAGTNYTFDVSENWSAEGDFVWFARLVLQPSDKEDIRVTRGSLTLGQLSAVRTNFTRLMTSIVMEVQL